MSYVHIVQKNANVKKYPLGEAKMVANAVKEIDNKIVPHRPAAMSFTLESLFKNNPTIGMKKSKMNASTEYSGGKNDQHGNLLPLANQKTNNAMNAQNRAKPGFCFSATRATTSKVPRNTINPKRIKKA